MLAVFYNQDLKVLYTFTYLEIKALIIVLGYVKFSSLILLLNQHF